jgi:hypothetical protein
MGDIVNSAPKGVFQEIYRSTLIRKTLIVASFIAITLLLFMKNFTSDFGIHIATGREVVEAGRIPHTEFLSYPLLGQPMNYEEVGFQIPLYLVYKYLGVYGVSFFIWAAAFLAYLFLYKALRARDVRPFVILLTMLVFTFAFRIRLQPRPEAIVYMFCAFLIYGSSLFYYKGNRWIIYLFPPLFLLWANMHPSTMMGLGIVGAYGTQSLVIAAKERFSRETMVRYVYIPLAVFALCVLGSILSKHGVSSITTPLSLMANPTVMQNTSELTSVANSSFYTPYKQLLFLVLFFGAAGLLAWRIRVHDVITGIYGMRLPLQIARGVGFMSILTIPLVASCADGVLDKAGEYFRRRQEEKEALLRKAARAEKSGKKREQARSKKNQAETPDASVQPHFFPVAKGRVVFLATPMFLLIMGTSAFYQYYKLRDVMEWGIGITEHKYSFKCAEFLRGLDIKGNMFNFFDIGGFLEWQLYPRKLVFIDGRGAGLPQFPEHQIVSSGMKGTEDVFSKYNITYVVIKAADSSGTVLPLVNYLAVRQDWGLVFADGLMMVFVKNIPENRQILEKYAIPKGIINNHIVTELVHYTSLGVNKQFVYSSVANYYRQINDPVNAGRYMEYFREASEDPWVVQAMDRVFSGR